MTRTNAVSPLPVEEEDPLAYLPVSAVQEFTKGRKIYGGDAAERMYLVIEGRVSVFRQGECGRQFVVQLCHPNDLFGDSAWLGMPEPAETAVALDPVRVMTWSIDALSTLMMQHPRFGVALVRMLAQRCGQFQKRLRSFAADTIAQRLGRALLELARPADPGACDSVYLGPLTHEWLGQYVGASREMITQALNQFRRDGLVRYSRRGITVARKRVESELRGGAFTITSSSNKPSRDRGCPPDFDRRDG